jgi:hypothetical protein
LYLENTESHAENVIALDEAHKIWALFSFN